MLYPLKESVDLKAQPYSEIEIDKFNVERAKRIVYCQYCKYSVETRLYAVKCGQCRSFLIEYVLSHFNNGQLDR